jgi:hypothetical protein
MTTASKTFQLTVTAPAPVDSYTMRAPTGSDKYLNPVASSDGTGTEASPWNTLTAAKLRTLVAGQALWIKNGSLAFPEVTSGLSSGTAGNRITVSGYPGHTATLTFTDATQGVRFGSGNYWDFRNLSLSCQNFGITFGNSDAYASSKPVAPANYIRVIDCIGTRSSVSFTDNSAILLFGDNTSGYCTAPEVVRGSYSGPTAANNQSLLFFDYTDNIVVLGTLLVGCANPIYFKHTDVNSSSTPGGIVKNCIIRNAGRKFSAAMNWVQYSNTVFDSTKLGLDEDGGGLPGGQNCTIRNCTFLDADIAGNVSNSITNTVMTDCVLAGSSRWAVDSYTASERGNSSNYTACTTAAHYWRNGSVRTLAAHKAAYPTQEANGVAGAISFAGSASSTPANWALSGGSAGKNASSTGSDCGVNAANLLTVN